MTGEAVLRAAGVVVDREGSRVLCGVDLRVQQGDVLLVLGPTGVGKTTLFRVLVGELRADRGRVWLGRREVTDLPLWERARLGLGYVPQTPSVLPDLTVRANLETFVRLSGRAGGGVDHWAELAGLTHRMSLRASELSGGERRQLELARALIGRPKVLVCDEPFSGIDPIGAWRVAEILRQQAAQGLAVVLADHHASIALRMCTRAMLLVDGEVKVDDEPVAFGRHGMVRARYLGDGENGGNGGEDAR